MNGFKSLGGEISTRRRLRGAGSRSTSEVEHLATCNGCSGNSQNPFIRTLSGFPNLEPDEALLENAFTPVAYRGHGIMSAAMALIAERAADIGARNVLTFVGDDNIGSLKGCQRAGFHPHLLNQRVRLLYGMINSNKFERLAADDPRRTMQF